EEQLEPQLVRLVDGDEEQLVVRGWIRRRHLLGEQFGQPQVAPVRQQRLVLTERRHPENVPPQARCTSSISSGAPSSIPSRPSTGDTAAGGQTEADVATAACENGWMSSRSSVSHS